MPDTRTDMRANKNTAQVSVADLAKSMHELLGPRLMSLMIGVEDKTVTRWMNGTSKPTLKHERRLRCAYQIFEMLKSVDASPTIRAWFMGMNPQLDDTSPAEAIAEDHLKDTLAAARAFRAGG